MNNENKIKILGIAGSLRKDSYSKALLNATKDLVPEQMEIEIFDIKDIPLFNEDLEGELPESVTLFKNKIAEAGAIIFITPEYNYSIPGVLKNAIDWASRPYGQNSWNNKPAAIISSSVGIFGGSRAQYHLRQTLVSINMYPLNHPEVIVPLVSEKFNENLILIDEKIKDTISKQLEALDTWTRKLMS